MSYDEKCLELAQYYLPGEPRYSRMVVRFAQAIQDAICEWRVYEHARITAALTPRKEPD